MFALDIYMEGEYVLVNMNNFEMNANSFNIEVRLKNTLEEVMGSLRRYLLSPRSVLNLNGVYLGWSDKYMIFRFYQNGRDYFYSVPRRGGADELLREINSFYSKC